MNMTAVIRMQNNPFYTTPINREIVSQRLLDVSDKQRSNPLAWNGQFSPQFVEVLLSAFGSSNSRILDPFVGSGTVLHEAGMRGLSAHGVEVNPAAVLLARVYTLINVSENERRLGIAAVDNLISSKSGIGPLFCEAIPESSSRRELLNRFAACKSSVEEVLLGALITLSDFGRSEPSWERVSRTWSRLKDLVISLPVSNEDIEVTHGDAREMSLNDHSVDLIITSPPYINVFNYHQNYRGSVEALGWDVLSVAPSEIGSNRKYRGNRYLTVVQYCLDMCEVLQECQRVLKPEGRAILVVGRESKVRGTPFWNGAIVADIAHTAVGMSLLMRQERKFTNRFGQLIYEDILHFGPGRTRSSSEFASQLSKQVALKVLEEALDRTSDAARKDLETAIAQSVKVQPSPRFSAN